MTEPTAIQAKDWAGDLWMYLLLWGWPMIAIVAGFFCSVPFRTVIWVAALLWMGSACLANARRCGRTHCHYTGPFYLLLIIPVLLQGSGTVTFGQYAWYVLGGVILLGAKLIWWASETAFGQFLERNQKI